MKLLVKKFSLRHNGKLYCAGQIAEMASEEALALAKAAPLEFEAIADSNEAIAAPAASLGSLQGQQNASEDSNTDGAKETPEGQQGSSKGQEMLSEEEVPDYEKMTVSELKTFATKEGLNLGRAKTKAEIIGAIMNQIEEDEGAEDGELPAYNPEAVLK